MPYKVQKDGDQYCVHKENADGSIGERVACHDTESKAESQVRALYASEADKSVEIEIEMDNENEDEATPSGSKGPSVIGYRSFVSHVEGAWERESEEDLRYSHVREVFSDHVIVAMGYGMNARMYKVPYSISGDEIEFDKENMTKVELKTEWVEKSLCIKAVADGKIGGYGILWGDQHKKDLHGEWFAPDTEELTKVFDEIGTVPVLFHHGMDETLKTSIIGQITKMVPDQIGLWWEAKVTEHEIYKQYIKPLLDKKVLFSSSGTFPGAKRVDESTKMIKRWPVAEMTMTHTPAEFRFLERPLAEIKGHYKSLGIDSTELFGDEVNDSTENQRDAEEAVDGNADRELAELAQEWLNLQRLQVNN